MEKHKNIIFFVIFIAIIIIVLVLTLRNKAAKAGNAPKQPEVKPPAGTGSDLPHVKAPATALEAYKNLPSGTFPLKKGQKSKLVFLIQYALNLLYGTSLKLDGDFGSKTQTAITDNLKTAEISKDLAVKLFIVVGKHPQCDPAMIQAIKDINLFPTYYAN